MRSAPTAAAAAFAAVLLLAGCGSASVAQSSPSPVGSPSGVPASASASPGQCLTYESLPGLCTGVVGRVPTHEEYQAMSAIGAPAIEKALGYKDWSVCSAGENCFRVNPEPSGMVGTDAGVLNGGFGQYPGGGLGAPCWVFLYKDSGGWHFLNFACAQNAGYTPGSASCRERGYRTTGETTSKEQRLASTRHKRHST